MTPKNATHFMSQESPLIGWPHTITAPIIDGAMDGGFTTVVEKLCGCEFTRLLHGIRRLTIVLAFGMTIECCNVFCRRKDYGLIIPYFSVTGQ